MAGEPANPIQLGIFGIRWGGRRARAPGRVTKRRRPALDPPVGVATITAPCVVDLHGISAPRDRTTDGLVQPTASGARKSSSPRSPGARRRVRTSCTDRFATYGCRWAPRAASWATRSAPKNPHPMAAADKAASNSARSRGIRTSARSSPNTADPTDKGPARREAEEINWCGRSGRPRTRGARLGTPTDPVATATVGARWRTTRVRRYGRTDADILVARRRSVDPMHSLSGSSTPTL